MQSGGGRGDGSRAIREDRLVTLAVGGQIFPRNVGRQGNVAKAFDRFADVSLCREADAPQSVLAAVEHFGPKLSISEVDALTDANFPSRPNQSLPLVVRNLPREEDFDGRGQKFAHR